MATIASMAARLSRSPSPPTGQCHSHIPHTQRGHGLPRRLAGTPAPIVGWPDVAATPATGALAGIPVLHGLTPRGDVRCPGVVLKRCLVDVDLVEVQLAGLVDILVDVEPQAARLLAGRAQAIERDRCDEGVHLVRLD